MDHRLLALWNELLDTLSWGEGTLAKVRKVIEFLVVALVAVGALAKDFAWTVWLEP